MKKLIALFVCLLISPVFAQAERVHVDKYTKTKISGWNVYIHPELEEFPPVKKQMVKNLTSQLKNIVRVVSKPTLMRLRRTNIWLVYMDPFSEKKGWTGVYHLGRNWLRRNNLNPSWNDGFSLNKIFGIKWHYNGSIVFHELTHAYHRKYLKRNNPTIVGLFRASKKVLPKNARDRCPDKNGQRVYAHTDILEFFSMYSEVYFSKNGGCQHPFTRSAIRRYEPKMYNFLEKTWGPLRLKKAEHLNDSQIAPVLELYESKIEERGSFQISYVQRLLAQQGYSHIAVDGKYGKQTKNALVACIKEKECKESMAE